MVDFGKQIYPKNLMFYNIPYDDYGSGSSRTVTEYKYVATDGKFIYTLGNKKYSSEFARNKVSEPQIRVSNFEGCPHWYGVMYMPNGDSYELQCVITKEYLDIAHQMRGDWVGYKEGDSTGRFLSRSMLMSAFEMFKKIVK